MGTTTTACKKSVTSLTTGHTRPVSTAQRQMESTAYQAVLLMMCALISTQFVVSQEMPTDVVVRLTLIVLVLELITFVTLTPMAAQKDAMRIPTVLMTSVTSRMTPTPHAHTVKISTVNQVALVMSGAPLVLNV